MNRNVNSHFAENPVNIDLQRSQFDRSCTNKFTFNVGDVVPFYLDEVLPGDTFNVKTSKVVRLQTMLKPIMDNIYLDTYYFFIPNRLIWDHWKNFMGESDKAWTPSIEYTVPQLITPANGFPIGSLADYLGVPPSVKNGSINALPFRAYAKVMDDWFRCESLTDPLVIPTGDADMQGNLPTDEDLYCAYGGPLFKASKYHDAFTSCLPAPQSGPAVTLPIASDYFPVGLMANKHSGSLDGTTSMSWKSSGFTGDHYLYEPSSLVSGYRVAALGETDTASSRMIFPDNLYADGTSIGAVSVNDLRMAFQVQKFYEKCARGGRRYIEMLKSQFGVTSPDARLQRSEYLGGSRFALNVHEVTNNSESEQSFLGDLGAISHTADVDESFLKSFTEHGYVLGVCVARYDHSYGQGLEAHWLRKGTLDYYWPVFANISEQPVMKSRIFWNPETNDQVFGYQEAWAEYRFKPNSIHGEMRVDAPTTLSSWHLGDDYATTPSLSDEWIREDKTNLDRCLAVTSRVSHQLFADVFIQNICTRAMPMYSIPGLIDHH